MFSDVTEEHLFDSLALSVSTEDETLIPSTTNVSTIMSSWTRQAGYPILTVERNYDANRDQVTLSQRKYIYPSSPTDPVVTTWWIPYNYATPKNPEFNRSQSMGWMPQDEDTITITVDSLRADDYLLLDTYAGGYYRVIYDERNYRLISDAMVRNVSQFHVASRSTLLENVHEFFRSSRLTLTTVMDVLRILENDDEYVSWYPIQDILLEMDRTFSGHENYAIWRVCYFI